MRPLLSIIIPTLNEEKYLPLLLGDLASQTDKDFEVIVVDGNSQDKTVALANSFKNKLILTIKKVARRNVSFQRNTGVDCAVGEYVLLLDADTRLKYDFAKTLKDEIYMNKAEVYLPVIIPISEKLLYKVVFMFSNFLVKISRNWNRPLPTQAAMIFKREFFNSIGGYTVHNAHDNKRFFPEDHEIIIRAKKSGGTVEVLLNVIVRISQRRFDKQNQLKIFFTYLSSAIQMTLFSKMYDSKISYKMGG